MPELIWGTMLVVEPYEAINSLEASLRGLIQDVLGDKWMDNAGVSTEILEQRRTEEAARRKGAAVEQNLLAYTHIYELRKIMEKNWEKFKPVFDERKRLDVYMDRIEDFRNAPMHSRQLLPFERDLLSGIVGEIRNVTTIFRSQQGPDRRYYPVVESIVDSLGTEMNLGSEVVGMHTGIRLQVGDRVTFSCRAWDAQDREVSWSLYRSIGREQISHSTGNEATLELLVTDAYVGENLGLDIEMSSNGKYHRYYMCDFAYHVIYAVDPPSENTDAESLESEISISEVEEPANRADVPVETPLHIVPKSASNEPRGKGSLLRSLIRYLVS
jgi:SAV2148-like HEPN